ncbi:hypothetical protein BJX65DRAFT_153737 [Aspergillus insuetus]
MVQRLNLIGSCRRSPGGKNSHLGWAACQLVSSLHCPMAVAVCCSIRFSSAKAKIETQSARCTSPESQKPDDDEARTDSLSVKNTNANSSANGRATKDARILRSPGIKAGR